MRLDESWLELDVKSARKRYEYLNSIPKRKNPCPACPHEARGLATACYVFLERTTRRDDGDTRYSSSKLVKMMVEVEVLCGHTFDHPAFTRLWEAADAIAQSVKKGSTLTDIRQLIDELDGADNEAQALINHHFFDIDHKYGE